MNGVKDAVSVCYLVEWGAVALFGPPDFRLSRIIGSLAESFQLLFFDISWDSRTNADKLNIFPESNKFLQAIEDLVLYWKWQRITIIYEDDHSKTDVKWKE